MRGQSDPQATQYYLILKKCSDQWGLNSRRVRRSQSNFLSGRGSGFPKRLDLSLGEEVMFSALSGETRRFNYRSRRKIRIRR